MESAWRIAYLLYRFPVVLIFYGTRRLIRLSTSQLAFFINLERAQHFPANILYKSIAGRYRPVSYPDGPITARYRFIKNAYWVNACRCNIVGSAESGSSKTSQFEANQVDRQHN